MSEWQPIETAPKDLQQAIIWVGGEYFAALQIGGEWLDDHGEAITAVKYPPAYWMPLPAPPTDTPAEPS